MTGHNNLKMTMLSNILYEVISLNYTLTSNWAQNWAQFLCPSHFYLSMTTRCPLHFYVNITMSATSVSLI